MRICICVYIHKYIYTYIYIYIYTHIIYINIYDDELFCSTFTEKSALPHFQPVKGVGFHNHKSCNSIMSRI